MIFQVPQFWVIVGDSFQILLCLLILGFFIKNRVIHQKFEVNKSKNDIGHSFNAQVFNITVRQQVNQAFTNIIGTIAAERNGLARVLGPNSPSSENDNILKVQSDSQLPHRPDNHWVSDDRIASAERHDTVRKFSAKGLNARKISEELKIPISEVELVLSLQKK
jgi:hypothetical protein